MGEAEKVNSDEYFPVGAGLKRVRDTEIGVVAIGKRD